MEEGRSRTFSEREPFFFKQELDQNGKLKEDEMDPDGGMEENEMDQDGGLEKNEVDLDGRMKKKTNIINIVDLRNKKWNNKAKLMKTRCKRLKI